MSKDLNWASGAEIAQAVGSGASSALNVVDDALARIEARNPVLNAFTADRPPTARGRRRAKSTLRPTRRNCRSPACPLR